MYLNKKFENWKWEFDFFIDGDGVLRCGGRLFYVDFFYSVKYFIFFDVNYGFTILVVRSCYESVMYDGVKETLIELRFKFWFVRGR